MENQTLPYPTIERVMEVTKFTDPVYAKAAIATLRWLDAGAPHQVSIDIEDREIDKNLRFDMKTFVNYKGMSCGTTCCIAGSIAIHADPGVSESNLGTGSLKRIFALSDNSSELFNLFYPFDENRGYGIPDKTPEQAAKCLRKYLFTGVVDWSESNAE